MAKYSKKDVKYLAGCLATKAGLPKDPDEAFLGWCKKFTKGKQLR